MTAERFPIEAGHIIMFARAIGDPNPIYSDETYAAGTECGGIVAPPTFVQEAGFMPSSTSPTTAICVQETCSR